MRHYGVSDPTARLRRVLVRTPSDDFAVEDPAAWNYTSRPDLEVARSEHRELVGLLEAAGAEVVFHDAALPGLADAQFVFDPVLMTPAGAIVLSMGKSRRLGEEEALARALEAAAVPVVGCLEGAGRAEGGDLLRLDRDRVAVGLGFRTDREGCNRLSELLRRQGIEVLAFDLPWAEGPAACLHLRSLVSLLAPDLAVVHRRLLPVRFLESLRQRFELVDVPDEELATMGPNVLALGPRDCLVIEGSPVTRRRLERAGCRVRSYRGRELSLKAEGGPTCLTLPLWRDGG